MITADFCWRARLSHQLSLHHAFWVCKPFDKLLALCLPRALLHTF